MLVVYSLQGLEQLKSLGQQATAIVTIDPKFYDLVKNDN
jgi:hypothetical protein